MARNRIEMNSQSVAALLKSPGVRDDLERRAEAVKAAAGGDAVVDIDITSGSRGAAPRLRARVSLANMSPVHARRHEAKHGTLARALAAGGG